MAKKKSPSKKKLAAKITTKKSLAKKTSKKRSSLKAIKYKPSVGPQCPNCGSTKKGGLIRVSPSSNTNQDSPWTGVLSIINCAKCKSNIPAHLWDLWENSTAAQARKEWLEVYKPKK